MSVMHVRRYMMIARMIIGLALIAGFFLLSTEAMRVLTPVMLALYVVSFAITSIAIRSDKRTVSNG